MVRLIDGGLYFDTALRNARVCAVFSRHQTLKQASHQSKSLTKASKPPNQKYLHLVEVPRAESLVDEVVCALLTCVAEERVEVGGLEGFLPALRGPVVT